MSDHRSSKKEVCAHDSVKTVTTDAGMVYTCERCSRHWFRTYEQAAAMSGEAERTPPSGSGQPYDDRLREVSRATIDAKLLGCGFLMLLPDGTYQYVSPEDIYLKPKRPAGETDDGYCSIHRSLLPCVFCAPDDQARAKILSGNE